jgi:hypothetical protein
MHLPRRLLERDAGSAGIGGCSWNLRAAVLGVSIRQPGGIPGSQARPPPLPSAHCASLPRATALIRPPPLGEKISASAERGRYVEVGHVDGDERNPDRVSVDEGVPQAPELEGR